MSALFAATHPERTLALVLYGAFARAGASMISNQEFEESLREIEDGWPDSIDPAVPAPSLSGDEGYPGSGGARSSATRRARAQRSRCIE